MRAIDADALLGKFSFYKGVRIPEKDIDGFHNTVSYHDIKAEIRNAPTITPADNWTPCAERLPKEHKRGMIMCSDLVEVTVKNSKWTIYTAVDYTVNGKWETYEVMETGCTVLAWQPLPAPWTGEKKGE